MKKYLIQIGVSYDVQCIPVDKGWVYLHVLVDLDSKNIIALELTEDEKKKPQKSFLIKALMQCHKPC